MTNSIIYLENTLKKASRKLFRQKKTIYQHVKSYSDRSHLSRRNILFVIGCQRSGTSILQEVFEKDINTKIYGESSKLSSIEGLRLNPLNMVKKELQKDQAQLIIMKPLVESQNILQLLDYFDGSKALWIYRDYKGVAASNLKMFGIRNGIDDIRSIAQNEPENWRSEKVSENTRQIILKHFSENMNPYDAAVLFWYARNRLFFDLGLDKMPAVLMCKYEDLVSSPIKVFCNIYSNLGQNFPGEKILQEVFSDSLRKGREIEISPAIEELANELLDQLDEVYLNKGNALNPV